MTIGAKMEMIKFLNLMGRTRGRWVVGGPEAVVYYEVNGVAYLVPDLGLAEIYYAKLEHTKAIQVMFDAEMCEHDALYKWLDGAILREHEGAMSALEAESEILAT